MVATKATKIWREVEDYVIIFFTLLLYTFFWRGFIFSHEVTSGGLSGMASVITWACGKAGFVFDVGWPYNIINGILVILSVIILGWKFSIRTVFSVIVLGVSIPLSGQILTRPMLPDDPAMAVVIGSVGIGFSLAMVFARGGSTGGTDIIASIINKYRHMALGRALLAIDVVTVGLSWFIFKDPDLLVYSFIQIIVCNLSVDFFLNGYRQSMQFFIISSQYELISRMIIREVGRGVTLLSGTGAFSGSDVKVMMVIARRHQAANIMRIVKDIDEKAFITEAPVRGVYGEGFDVNYAKTSKKKTVVEKSDDGKTTITTTTVTTTEGPKN